MLIELTEAIQAALDARLNQAHVALPGVVVSYNAARQTADVRPGVKRAVPTDVEGIFTTETLPVIPSVPVCWPRGNGQHFAPGLAAGDGVLIVVCDIDPATWVRTGEVSDPGDLRKMDLSHAVCIPGFVPSGDALSPSEPDLKAADAAIGGATQEASVANAVATELFAIATALDTLAAAIPATNSYTAATNTVLAVRNRIKSAVLKIGS